MQDFEKRISETELFQFLISLKITVNEAQFVYALLEDQYEGDDLALITLEQVRDALEFVRQHIPLEHRKSMLFGVN